MSELTGQDPAPAEDTLRHHRRAVGLIAAAIVVMASAGAAFLHVSLPWPFGDTPAPISQSVTPEIGFEPIPGGPGFPASPIPRPLGLIPGGAISLLIEQFGGLNDNPPGRLVAWARIGDPAGIRPLINELNTLPPFPIGAISCPSDDGSYFTADLGYRDGGSVPVRVDARGCQAVYVGKSQQPVAWAVNSPQVYVFGGLMTRSPGA